MCECGIGRGDGCFVAFSRGSPFELFVGAILLASLRISTWSGQWYHLQMATLGKLSNVVEADNTDEIKLLYGECRNKASIGALP